MNTKAATILFWTMAITSGLALVYIVYELTTATTNVINSNSSTIAEGIQHAIFDVSVVGGISLLLFLL